MSISPFFPFVKGYQAKNTVRFVDFCSFLPYFFANAVIAAGVKITKKGIEKLVFMVLKISKGCGVAPQETRAKSRKIARTDIKIRLVFMVLPLFL